VLDRVDRQPLLDVVLA